MNIIHLLCQFHQQGIKGTRGYPGFPVSFVIVLACLYTTHTILTDHSSLHFGMH